MSPQALLAVYCLAILLASLAGGWITILVRLTHARLELALSFVSGVMFGISLLHMLPHAVGQFSDAALASSDAGDWHASGAMSAMWWVLGGFLGIFLLERFFPFHHHEPASTTPSSHHQHHHHHTVEKRQHSHGNTAPRSGAVWLHWPAALLGFSVHSIVGGIALAAAVEAQSHAGFVVAGLGVFLVIVLHKPFDSIAVGTLMAAGGAPHLSRHMVNAVFGLMVPLGVVLFHFGLAQMNIARGPMLGALLALGGGVFLCIALSDILPELQFHRHDRVKLSIALLGGVALAGAIAVFEAHSDEHAHEDRDQTVAMISHPNSAQSVAAFAGFEQ